jgi:hypothetical protein
MPGAIDDALATIAAARHLSVDGSLASVVFAYRLENSISGVLVQNLLRLSPAQLNELASGLKGLPSGSNLIAAFESEKLSRNDLLEIGQGAKSRDELIERLLNKVPVLQSNRKQAEEIVDGCGGSVKGYLNCVEQQHSFYASWTPRFSLSPEQFEATYMTEFEALSKTNTVVRQFTPALPRFRWAEAYEQTRRALLRTAIAIRLPGSQDLNQHFDPYDKKPFTYTAVGEGSRLESRLTDGGIPISVSILPNSPLRESTPEIRQGHSLSIPRCVSTIFWKKPSRQDLNTTSWT